MTDIKAAAQAVNDFFESLMEDHDFSGELAMRLSVAATPVIAAVTLTEGNLYWHRLRLS